MRAAGTVRMGAAALVGWMLAGSHIPARESADAAGELTVTLRTAELAVHPKEDLVVLLSFQNRGTRPIPLEEGLFSIDGFEVLDAKGKSVPRSREKDPSPSPGLSLPGGDTHEWKVNLSEPFPKVTGKRGTVTVRWSAASFSAGPLRVVITEPYSPEKDRYALIETEVGLIRWRLLPEYAPAHVENFVNLARQGFYDGTTIFRAVPGLKIEGGDPRGDGTGSWDDLMMPEISREAPTVAGMVGASRLETSMTSRSMFFILLAPSPFMKGRHTFFAVLEDSWDTVSHILARQRKGDTKMDDAYLIHEPVRILSITIK